ncbi:MAG: hypothetical protein KAS32_03605 [Candidatus Peribacteraceae bacterium]|nr:hypothetical protein [Candidatus Peribacteraceae bacterium]
MPLRTKFFKMLPWVGGVNTSVDPSVIDPNELIQADNVTFDTRGSRRVREGIDFDWDSATESVGVSIVGMHQFFRDVGGTSKVDSLVAVSTKDVAGIDGVIYNYTSGGTRSALTLTVPFVDDVSKAAFTVMGNKLIICTDGSNNPVKVWTGTGNVTDLGGGPPNSSICQQHLGRLWLIDPTNIDRLHYSTTGNITEWQGVGDSGALDIGIGDGDPEGITAIFPSFKGDLFIAKKTKLYRISGYTPETCQISLVSSGIGCVSHNSVTPIDQDDVYFVSERGIHSLVTTANFGDFQSSFLSQKIHKTFIENFSKVRLDHVWSTYVPELQSVMFAFQDSDFTGSYNNSIWLYNIVLKSWYRWPNFACESVYAVQDDDSRVRPFFGGANERIGRGLTDDKNDIDNDGNDAAIPMTVKTGIIYIDEAYNIKGFKKFALYFRPTDSHSINVRFEIDNYAAQNILYSEIISSDLLGVDLILGQSDLGFDIVLAPWTVPVDGYGRGVQITISHDAIDQFVEIQGFGIEYELGSTGQEVVQLED